MLSPNQIGITHGKLEKKILIMQPIDRIKFCLISFRRTLDGAPDLNCFIDNILYLLFDLIILGGERSS